MHAISRSENLEELQSESQYAVYQEEIKIEKYMDKLRRTNFYYINVGNNNKSYIFVGFMLMLKTGIV